MMNSKSKDYKASLIEDPGHYSLLMQKNIELRLLKRKVREIHMQLLVSEKQKEILKEAYEDVKAGFIFRAGELVVSSKKNPLSLIRLVRDLYLLRCEVRGEVALKNGDI
ncbi:hypothetical protein ACJJI5_15425 [Microbulbifer sp. EKSA008]|uniref:hypothetical protein n=1 Tax=unclassified Microbulbifer TaxID=2619833 RepID=UPI00403964BE